jgi:carbon-monoxide dehydrogenase medium subunit
MIPAEFDYHAPTTLDEALSLLDQFGDEAKLLAGGHSLIPALKLRLSSTGHLIDLGRVSGLSYIREDGGRLCIGARATHHEVESSALLQQKCPLLAECASYIGDVQVRNRGTMGGSLAHADPAADYPAAILALEAEIQTAKSGGKRVFTAEDFQDIPTTALTGEIPRGGVAPQPRTAAPIWSAATRPRFRRGQLPRSLHLMRRRAKVRSGLPALLQAFRAYDTEKALTGKTPDDNTITKLHYR